MLMKPITLIRRLALVVVAALLPLAAAAQTYFKPLSMDGVELMAMVKFGIQDYETNLRMAKGLYELKQANLYQPQKDSPLMLCNPSGGCVYHQGKLYVNDYDDTGRVQEEKPHWKVYDATTWELLSDTELKDNCESTTTSLAYDPVSDQIYGFLSTYTETFFVKVDPQTGAVTRIAELSYKNHYSCIACSKDGQLYCIYFDKDSSTHYLARLRKTDGRVANVGVLSVGNLMPGDAFVDGGYAQSLFFNNSTGKLYWMYQSSTGALARDEYTPIMEVNTQTATANMVAYLQDALLIPGAFFLEPDFTSPGVVSGFAFNPTTTDRLTGTLSFTAPTTDYVGDDLTGTLTITVTENDEPLVTLTANPGEAVTTEPLTFTNEQHELKIRVTNDRGEQGPASTHQFYAGYDVPKAPQNIQLTADGLTTTVTWDAPTEGVSGAPINPDDYTYTVVRYPYEVTVATGLKERSFTEEHPADMTRYVYLIKAIDSQGREGRSAYSNNLIVGTPLDVPYGGPFQSAFDMYNYYTIVNANGDTQTWKYDMNSGWAYYEFNPSMAADDWLISPPINYKKGTKYVVTFNAYSTYPDYPESFEVKCGPGRTPESQSTLLLSVPEVPSASDPAEATPYRVEFTAPQDSVYHFSIHVNSPAYHYYLYLNNIYVQEYDPTGIGETQAETVQLAVSDGTLRVSNPDGDRLSIYTAGGQLVEQCAERTFERSLSAGVYLVVTPRGTFKVAVR